MQFTRNEKRLVVSLPQYSIGDAENAGVEIAGV